MSALKQEDFLHDFRLKIRILLNILGRYLQTSMMYARKQLNDIYSSARLSKKMNFKAAGQQFEATRRIKQGPVDIDCYDGMRGDKEKQWCGQSFVK